MQVEIIMESEESKRQIPYDITYTWNLRYDTNEPIYETETKSETQKTNCGCQGGGEQERGGLGI